ncbi:MAG: SRPBCC family protein [Xanthobacteraceae bacterium]
MSDIANFKPKTVYVIYIASTPAKVWEALTSSEFTGKYFWDLSIELEPKLGGAFALRMPDGTVNVQGKVIAWDPPRKFAVTWQVEWPVEFAKLPECHVTYEIAPAGDAVRLTMTESHSWNVPEAILSGGRMGWPAVLSGLKSLLETGTAPVIKMQPPKEMIEAIKNLKL